MVADISDVVLLLRYAMNIESTQNIRISEEGIKCYQVYTVPPQISRYPLMGQVFTLSSHGSCMRTELGLEMQ